MTRSLAVEFGPKGVRINAVAPGMTKTPSIADALAVMVEAYRKLGMDKLAEDALRVLELNHPEHPATKALKKAS